LPFVRNALGKTAGLITKYVLKIKNVKDPMSGCFAFSRHVIQDFKFEGKGKEALLEILVKNNHNSDNGVTVMEIPIKQHDTLLTRNIDFGRILNYSRDVWELYKHGKISNLESHQNTKGQKNRSSKVFLSKAGRFFTVGASGLVVNYAASFLLSILVPNVWYMHGTLFGIILSITSNFLLNKLWTFEDRDFSPEHILRRYVLFLAICAVGAAIQLSLVYVFVEASSIPYAISLIMAVCIASLGNFLLNKKITFEEKIWE
jgi:dolichol-phosphate mannosyltransferase